MKIVAVAGSFDDLRSRHVRFLQEAARSGELHLFLWSDARVRELKGRDPWCPLAERLYVLESIRYVARVHVVDDLAGSDPFPKAAGIAPDVWAIDQHSDQASKRAYCAARGIEYRMVTDAELVGFPGAPSPPPVPDALPGSADDREAAARRRVIVTGCYDWFHSGHVRFFEEAAAFGDIYVVVGHDANIRLLKGEGHPLFPQDERRYMVQAVRFVKEALISTGDGWLDAAPQIERIRPHVYVVNEDGDKPDKRDFCRARGIEYVVLKREPRPGLPPRQSTNLRGF